MTDIIPHTQTRRRRSDLARLVIPRLATPLPMIGAALMALGRTIADSNALGYSGPYQTSRRPAVRRDDRPEDGRDPNW